MLASQVSSASSQELLAFFNANTGGNQVAKFRDRATAEKRVLSLIAEMAAEEAGDQAAAKAACKRGDDAVPMDDLPPTFLPPMSAPAPAPAKAAPAAQPLDRDTTKPWQRAKQLVCDMTAAGKGTRKEIIAAGVAAGIKYNTIDGAYYSMIVQPRNEKR